MLNVTSITELEMETSLRYQFTAISKNGGKNPKKQYITVLRRIWRKWSPCIPFVEMNNDIATQNNSMIVPQKSNTELP